MKNHRAFHDPIMVDEVVHYLAPGRGGVFVDGTVGGGGHARAVAERLSSEDRLIGIDLDPEALEHSAGVLSGVEAEVELVHGNFRSLPEMMAERGIDGIDGCILDLGVSSHQLDTPERGFSYRHPDSPLDMRMNPHADTTAADILNGYSRREIRRILREYGEERWAARIAEFVVDRRQDSPYETSADLVQTIRDAVPAAARRGGGHPARRTFQALRIAVNGELERLEDTLRDVIGLLNTEGRLVAISFHSLEDRAVKRVFRDLARQCRCPIEIPVCSCDGPVVRELTRRPVRPSEEEVESNPRSSSAKLRAVEKL